MCPPRVFAPPYTSPLGVDLVRTIHERERPPPRPFSLREARAPFAGVGPSVGKSSRGLTARRNILPELGNVDGGIACQPSTLFTETWARWRRRFERARPSAFSSAAPRCAWILPPPWRSRSAHFFERARPSARAPAACSDVAARELCQNSAVKWMRQQAGERSCAFGRFSSLAPSFCPSSFLPVRTLD